MFPEHSKHQLKIRIQMMLLELRYEPVKRFEASQKTRDQVGIIGLFFTDVSQSPAQAPGPPPCTRPWRIGSNPFSESSMRLRWCILYSSDTGTNYKKSLRNSWRPQSN